MKKLILLFFVLLTFALLVSCGDEPVVDPVETIEETVENGDEEVPLNDEAKRLSDEEKAKYFKVVEFELTDKPFRDVIVDYMRKQSDIEWVCGADFSVTESFENWGIQYWIHKQE